MARRIYLARAHATAIPSDSQRPPAARRWVVAWHTGIPASSRHA
jgi:hypothetical protein